MRELKFPTFPNAITANGFSVVAIWGRYVRQISLPIAVSDFNNKCYTDQIDRRALTCNGFSPDDSLDTYFDGKNPTLPRHLPFHQSGSDVSMTVTL